MDRVRTTLAAQPDVRAHLALTRGRTEWVVAALVVALDGVLVHGAPRPPGADYPVLGPSAGGPEGTTVMGAGRALSSIPSSRLLLVLDHDADPAELPQAAGTVDEVDPATIADAIAAIGVRPEACLALAGTPASVHALREAGCVVVATTTQHTMPELAEAHHFVLDLDALQIGWHADGVRVVVSPLAV